jgi:DNA repair protein RAD5
MPYLRYKFPFEPNKDGVIDLTSFQDEERPFYFNPYSGELSLEFPKAERCLGGILACVSIALGPIVVLNEVVSQ